MQLNHLGKSKESNLPVMSPSLDPATNFDLQFQLPFPENPSPSDSLRVPTLRASPKRRAASMVNSRSSFILNKTRRKIVRSTLHKIRRLLLLLLVIQSCLRLLQLLHLLRIEGLILHLKQMLPPYTQILTTPIADLTCCHFQPLNLFSQCFIQCCESQRTKSVERAGPCLP